MISIADAFENWELYESMCNKGRAQSQDAQVAFKTVKKFFEERNIKNWTIGAIILGSKYYAKFLNSTTEMNMDVLKKEAEKLGVYSDLARDLINHKVFPIDFKMEI